MAALASSRIATGGVFQKPQANSAATASAAGSLFQQLLGATGQVGQDQDQNAQSTPDAQDGGKNSSGDGAPNGSANQGASSVASIIAAAIDGTLVKDAANNDASGHDNNAAASGATGSGTGADGASASSSNTASSTQVDAANSSANQDMLNQLASWIAAQASPEPAGKDQNIASGNTAGAGTDASTSAADNNPGASATDNNAGTGSSPAVAPNVQIAAAIWTAAAARDQAQPSDTAQTEGLSSAPVPAAPKNSPSGKSDASQNNRQQAGDQTNATDPSALAMAAAAAMAPLPSPATSSSPAEADATEATAIGDRSKADAKNTQAGSSQPSAGADRTANLSPAKSGAADDKASAGTPAQQGTADASQTANGSQSGDQNNATQNSDSQSNKAQTDSVTQVAPADKQSPPLQSQQTQPQPQAQTSVAAIQPASQPQTQTTAGTTAVSQHVQVGAQDASSAANTVNALAVAIAAKSQSGNKQFDIRLDPPELGRVEVRLSIDQNGKAQASLSADQPSTLNLLKTDAPILTRALRDAGLNVAQNGLNFSLRGQDRQNSSGGSSPRSSRSSGLSLIATSAIGSVAGGANYQGPADGRLDIRV